MSVLNEHTMVLNSKWKAIGIDTIKESLKKITKGSCRFMNPYSYHVHTLEDWYDLNPDEEGFEELPEHPVICAARRKFVAPRVVLLVDYDDMPKNEVRLSRDHILQRDKGCCQYCGTKVVRADAEAKLRKVNEYTLDHIIPRAQGGKTTWVNIATCCFKCNSRKRDRTPEQAGMKLKREPVKPKWSLSMVRNLKRRPKCWELFLAPGEWGAELLTEMK